MIIAITTEGCDLDSTLDARFGRAKQFMLYDTERDEYRIVDNAQNLNADQGAGIQAAQNVAAAGARALITGHTGPKAFLVLQKAEIPVYLCESIPLRQVVEKYKRGELQRSDGADVESHWV